MKSSMTTATILTVIGLAAAPAIAQASPAAPPPAEKQHTDGDGITSIGPASGAYSEYSDPKRWDAESKAWHKQHTSETAH